MVAEAYIKRGRRSEFNVVTSLLRKASPGCLVLQDRGFYGYRPLAEATRRGVHVLGRVGKHVVFKRTETASDGSYLAEGSFALAGLNEENLAIFGPIAIALRRELGE